MLTADQRSRTGYYVLLGTSLISCKLPEAKHFWSFLCFSRIESYGLYYRRTEVVWLRWLLENIGLRSNCWANLQAESFCLTKAIKRKRFASGWRGYHFQLASMCLLLLCILLYMGMCRRLAREWVVRLIYKEAWARQIFQFNCTGNNEGIRYFLSLGK